MRGDIFQKAYFLRSVFFISFSILLINAFLRPVKADVNYGDEIIMVSMGDSYSAGEGIEDFYGFDWVWSQLETQNRYGFPYDFNKDPSKKYLYHDWLAHRSEKSWSGQLELKGLDNAMKEYKTNPGEQNGRSGQWYFVAASGAETKHFGIDIPGKEKQPKSYNRMIFQDDYKSFTYDMSSKRRRVEGKDALPYQLDVFDSISKGEVDYVTLTIGGNDAGFTGILTQCVLGIGYMGLNSLSNKLNATWEDFYKEDGIRSNLKKTYAEIRNRAGDQAEIIVAGYPKLLNPDGCRIARSLISEDEARIVDSNVSNFNNAIEKLVLSYSSDKIHFVSVEKAFDGHEAYSVDNYINQLMPFYQHQDLGQGVSAYSFHPNEKGAKCYAECVQEKIRWIEEGKPINVSGKVIDKYGNPATDLSVVISISNEGDIVFSGETESDGFFNGGADYTNTEKAFQVYKNDSGHVLKDYSEKIEIFKGDKLLYSSKMESLIHLGENELGTIRLNEYENVTTVTLDNPQYSNDDNEEIIEEYKSFIRSKSEGGYYLIYDVDKDGFPELMINRMIPEERTSVYDVYTYKNGEFTFLLTPRNGYNHGPSTYASYPNGNGIVEHVRFKGKEYVAVETWREGAYDSETVWMAEIEDTEGYYNDEYDQVYSDSANGFSYYNHQYYQGDDYNPYFEGSFLLGQSSMDNFTAVYEAFGVQEDTNVITDDREVEGGVDTTPQIDAISFDYSVYNDFFGEGYKSVVESKPDEWALMDLDNDGVPEILFKENSNGWSGTLEVYYYNDQTGTVELAGSFASEWEWMGYCPEKSLICLDDSKAGYSSLDGYAYKNHSINWMYGLRSFTNHGSTPRTYNTQVSDSEGEHNLGDIELEEKTRIENDYFGELTEVVFYRFITGALWNLPDTETLHAE